MVLLKEFFQKVEFEKISRRQKKHAKLPSWQSEIVRCIGFKCLWLAYGQDHEKIVLNYHTDAIRNHSRDFYVLHSSTILICTRIPVSIHTIQVWWKSLFLLGLMLYVPVNNYGHIGMVSSPNHIFPGQVDKAVNEYFMHIFSLVTDNYPS